MTPQASSNRVQEVRILLVDDQPSVRYGLRLLFECEVGATIVGEAGSAAEGLGLAVSLRPDVVIMDVEMPGMNGIEAVERLKTLLPRCTVILLTIHDDATTRQRAMAAGAGAFVVKDRPEALQLAFRRSARPW